MLFIDGYSCCCVYSTLHVLYLTAGHYSPDRVLLAVFILFNTVGRSALISMLSLFIDIDSY